MTTKETLYLDDALAHAQFMAAQCREAANTLRDPELRRQASTGCALSGVIPCR